MQSALGKGLKEAMRLEVQQMREELRAAGKSGAQSAVAQMLGTSQATIQKLLAHTNGGKDLLDLILTHRGITAAELLRRHGEATPDELALADADLNEPGTATLSPREQAIALVAEHLGREPVDIRTIADSRLKHAHHSRKPLSGVEWIDLIRSWVREADLGAPPPAAKARRVDPKIFE